MGQLTNGAAPKPNYGALAGGQGNIPGAWVPPPGNGQASTGKPMGQPAPAGMGQMSQGLGPAMLGGMAGGNMPPPDARPMPMPMPMPLPGGNAPSPDAVGGWGAAPVRPMPDAGIGMPPRELRPMPMPDASIGMPSREMPQMPGGNGADPAQRFLDQFRVLQGGPARPPVQRMQGGKPLSMPSPRMPARDARTTDRWFTTNQAR